jgi:AraC-like DNA-binding protein
MSMLNILHCSHVPECRARVDKWFDGYYVLQLITRGGIDLAYDARGYRLEGCWFFPSYPGPHTAFHCAPGYDSWHHRHIAFTGPQVQHWMAEGLLLSEPQPGDARRHAAAFDELLAAARAPGRLASRLTTNLLERILLDLAEQRTARSNQHRWLDGVLGKLDRLPGHDVNYRALATELGTSLSTLRRKFQRATGMSIHNYVIDSRIARARDQLQHTDLPIKVIAEDLGYRDVYFFSRQFKQHVGLAPAAFRRSV